MRIRSMESKDIAAVRELIDYCKPLDLHTPFTYWILSEYFNNTCFVLEDEDEIVGYTGGMKSSSMDRTFYLWQIGLMPDYRGKGYFNMLMDQIINEVKAIGCKFLEFSVLSDNYQSINAFSNYAKKKGLPIEKRGSLSFYDKLTDEECKEDIYRISL
ncbi:GNAT family N-acetyltransferase [Lutispora thermophila]|uniref:Acetyltransferase (GNAT) family protein n=1 Tax=Lutispora thermophila DSM 19022 TaxID=1122184 RepID=A0A1M6FUS3_9FIRM|nr:GNAT family N-acetyltransferase [Lutispora thermophila]SHJ01432.1 Acetyltransferase (GNAT) family protein [Lutispora thermophila DSM 19022]